MLLIFYSDFVDTILCCKGITGKIKLFVLINVSVYLIIIELRKGA